MKRQPRPFVVEVKKRRGGLSGKRPIWAGIDLEVLANEVASSSHTVDTPDHTPERDMSEPAQSAMEGGDAHAHTVETITRHADPSEEIRPEADDDGRPVAVEPAHDARWRVRRRGRQHREAVSALPRGHRWKRRLPAVLLRRKKRGD